MEKDLVNNNALDAELMSEQLIIESDNTHIRSENDVITTLKATTCSQVNNEKYSDGNIVNSNFDQPIKLNENKDGNSNSTGIASKNCNSKSISASSLESKSNQLKITSDSNDESKHRDMENRGSLSNMQESNFKEEEESTCQKASTIIEELNINSENYDQKESNGNSNEQSNAKVKEELIEEEPNSQKETKRQKEPKCQEVSKDDEVSKSQVNVSGREDAIVSLMSTAQIKDENEMVSNNIESNDTEAMSDDTKTTNDKKECGMTDIDSQQKLQNSNTQTANAENSMKEVLVSVAVERCDIKEGDCSGECPSDDTLEGDTSGDCLSEDTLDDDDICCTNCQILSNSELETKFQCPLIIAMCTFKNDSILRLEQDGQKISKVNKDGDVIDTVQFDFEACDISLTNEGDILLANYHDECIMKYSKDGISSDFIKIQGRRPMALDVDTNSGELWVACVEEGDNSNYTSSARRYYHDGTLLQIIYFHDNTSSHYPMKISVCSKNGDVAVSETQVDETERMMVTVLNAWGTEKWEYPRDRSFNVEDAAFDCKGHLLATVPRDRSLHLVGEQGTLLSVIYQSCDSIPQIITPSFDGKIWVWCQDNEDEGFEIKVVKYLQIDCV